MSNCYPFSGDRSFAHGGTMVWNDQVPVQSSLDFSNVSESTLTDSINDSYATAVEDNETQYLSVLETTNDITLEVLQNINLENHKVTQEDLQLGNIDQSESLGSNSIDPNDQQVIIFTMDGSDDLYGIQLVQDETGNIQRYQFKFRTTDDGQLEAIPESIQLLESEGDTEENEAQEPVCNEQTEMVDTQVIYQENADIQENLVFEDQGQEVCSENVEEEGGTVHMFIKGEREIEMESEVNTDSQVYMEGAVEEGVLGEDPIIQYEESEVEEQTFEEEEIVDIKAGILEENSVSGNIKQEMFQEESQHIGDVDSPEEEYSMYNHHHIDIKPLQFQDSNEEHVSCMQEGDVEIDDNYVEVEASHETILEYQNYHSEDIQHVYEETDTNDSHTLEHVAEEDQFDKVFIKEQAFHGLTEIEQKNDEGKSTYYTEAGADNESDNEDYEIVEGLHITAEGDIGDDSSPISYQEPHTILQEVAEKSSSIIERANILKQPSLIKATKENKMKNNKAFVYYVVPHVEKENVNSLSVNYTTAATTMYRPVRSNPRSILKSSYPELKEEPEVKNVIDERFSKRFARSKEAVQARLFNNFISKTTIPHAPVRHTRLPRKQQIKPVDNRRDEEIIVQEVMVGSNGFIENIEDKLKNKDKLEVTQYVILSDSDEDYDPKKGSKRKKRYRKHKKVYMDCSEDSDTSVIEIASDDESKEDQQENPKRGRGRPKKSTDPVDLTDIKRRRGRPPKSSTNHSDCDESPQKKVCMEANETESLVIKKEFKCPHCTKTFPSLNSLSTHLHHHNLENRLRNSQANKQIKNTAIEYKHNCDICQVTFKNSILLKRHVCLKQTQKTSKRLECSVCKKSFPDTTALGVHKRLHVKENLVNMTVSAKVSPKKSTSSLSTSKLISPKKITSFLKSTFKCKDCSRVCFSQENLDLHEKTHRKFPCPSCGITFPSRLLLDTHVRERCVRGPSKLNNRRLSFKIKKSFVQSPRRKSSRLSAKSNVESNLNTTSITLNLNLECEQCGEKFTMFQDRFKHQVKVHGLETPDKNVLAEQKKRLHRPKALHGGIPAREGMRKVFADIRSQIARITPKKGTD